MNHHQCARATALATRALNSLPPIIGYVGVDMVLSERSTAHNDYVIEVNPRLTTSYVGLRAIAQTNLAQHMLAIAAGTADLPQFVDAAVEFDADGTVRWSP